MFSKFSKKFSKKNYTNFANVNFIAKIIAIFVVAGAFVVNSEAKEVDNKIDNIKTINKNNSKEKTKQNSEKSTLITKSKSNNKTPKNSKENSKNISSKSDLKSSPNGAKNSVKKTDNLILDMRTKNKNAQKSQNPAHLSKKSSSKSSEKAGKVNVLLPVASTPKIYKVSSDFENEKNSDSSSNSSKPDFDINSDRDNKSDSESNQNLEKESETDATKSKKSQPKSDFISEKLWKKFTTSDIVILENINQLLAKKNFDEALVLAKQLKNNVNDQDKSLSDALVDLILWNKYSNKIDPKKTSFSDISTFVMYNPYFPNINELRKNVEKVAIANNISYNLSEIYFNTNPALTTESKIFVIESKIMQVASEKNNVELRDSKSKVIQTEIAKIWIKENFTDNSELQFLDKYRNILTENDHVQRIERLLWEGKKIEALRILNFVGNDYKILFETILKFDDSPRYIDSLLLEIPRKLRSNELLTFKRLIWNKSRDNFDDVIEILIETPESFKYNDKWWPFKRLFGRELLKQGKYKKAYQVISKHNLPTTSPDFWEAEWTAGWIALRFLDEPKDALNHFQKMRSNVFQPVTVSRAIYWEAMCYEAMNQKSKAIATFKEGANYPIFFYGQLSIHKRKILDPLGSEKDIILPKSPEITGRDILKISESRGAQIAYILAVSGDRENASKIFEWLVNNSPTDGQIAVIMKIINEIGDKQLDAKISRVASKKNVFFVREKFQIIREVMNDEYAPLVHAIIKQESGFAPTAISRVGALGYMQLMPGTAKLVAKELGIRFDQKKLTRDIKYNIRLGSFYIKKLIDEFEGSEMLAIASYNAGPNATKRWINEFYDPRKQSDQDKIVDWIELITYSETRNYVQRIIENMIVYKYLMSRNNYDEVR
ncbi:MAG: hypothetical protein FJX30_00225 [Alphaproteobacteria bacterium]|nr:hypothetical protein [Alphaproteobacteria bacterium]